MDNTNALDPERRSDTLDLVYISIGAALIAVCAWISVPITVPFTLQTFAVFLVLLLLGGKRGTLASLVYIFMGAVGIPVFAGFKGGIGVLLGNTGGYILGFLLMGLIHIAMTRLFGRKLYIEIISLVIGLAACYAFGTAWFMFLYMKSTGPIGIMSVLGWCVFPFIIPDLVKMALAVIISRRVRFIIK